MPARVMVFIDYQNVFLTARNLYLPGAPLALSQINPARTAELLVRRRRSIGRLVGTYIYRGLPDPNLEPTARSANDRQAIAWAAQGATVIRRPLRYPRSWPNQPPQEKGVDVALAVDFVRLAAERAYDVGILFSRDSDLLPALETVVDLRLAHVEVASWRRSSRLEFPGTMLPWCHYLGEADYRVVHDPTDYTKPVTGM